MSRTKTAILAVLFGLAWGPRLLSVARADAGPEETHRLDKLNVGPQLADADVIVSGYVDEVARREGFPTLFSAADLEIYFDSAAQPTKQLATEAPLNGKAIFVLEAEKKYDDTPTVTPKDRNLLFLKRTHPAPELLKAYNIQDDGMIFVLCKGWQSAICLNLTTQLGIVKYMKEKYNYEFDFTPPVSTGILSKRYKITGANELISKIRDLVCWRNLKADEQVPELVAILNAKTNDLFYLDSITSVLKNRGYLLTQENGQYSANRPVKRDTTILVPLK